MPWYEPDDIWEVFDIKNREVFVNRFLVEGRFHKSVPHDIIKSFDTVSNLLAHSYYHAPLMDEAFSKGLLIMEMAIKLKTEQLGIGLKNPPNKKGKVSDKKLYELIKEICAYEEYKFFKDHFDRARTIRNHKVHPKNHSHLGAISHAEANARLFVNLINLLFLEKSALEDLYATTNQLETDLKIFQDGVLILEFEDKRVLIDGIHHVRYIQFENQQLLFLHVNPLTTKVHEEFIERKYPNPLVIVFSDFEIINDELKGIDLYENPVKLSKNHHPQNRDTYSRFKDYLAKIPEPDKEVHNRFVSDRALWEIEKLIYENCWKAEAPITLNT